MSGLGEGRADDHALLRLVREAEAAVNGRTVQKILHMQVQHPVRAIVAEGQVIALAGDGHIPGFGRLRQAGLAQGKGAHGALGLLPALVKVQQGDGVQAHVAVVGNGQGHGEMAVINKVIVPLLDAQRPGLDIPAAIDRQELFAVTGLAQVALFVQQGLGGGDLVLHDGSPFSLFCQYIIFIGERQRGRGCGLPRRCRRSPARNDGLAKAAVQARFGPSGRPTLTHIYR